jgi:glycosyltransferase involved in cell wall biosynthesis
MSYNEEEIIERCLQPLTEITDDIILVDSGSTDATLAIAKKYTDKIFYKKMDTYGAQKNYGADQAKYDWVFALDCDEIVNKELSDYLKNVELESGIIYRLNRKTYFGDRVIKYSGMTPDWINRLYNRTETHFDDYLVHERLTGYDTMKKIYMPGYVDHYSFEDYEDLHTKYQNYALLGARNLHKYGIKPSLLKVSLGPLFRFFKTYFLQLGFLDGKLGWTLSIEGARMVRKRWRDYYAIKRSQ